MNKEFFEAVKMLEAEKGISAEYLYEKIQAAIISATRNQYGNRDNVVCDIDPEKQTMRVYVNIAVVDEVVEPAAEMTLEQARAYDKNAQVGDFIQIDLEPKEFGRIVAQTAKSVIRQGIREAERELASQEFKNRHQEVVTATVVYVDDKGPDATFDATIEIGRATARFPRADQLPNDHFKPGQLIKVYVASIDEDGGVSYANISRRHPGFVKRLFETEVPEIFDGTIEIVSVSREPGSRTKIAVNSHDENVDPVGACIGPRGQRVNNVIDILGGEKIDIVRFSENNEEYIAAALAPAQVLTVLPEPDGSRVCHVIVPDNQLSLAIGNKGQNVRLAAKLTGWKIDIKPLSSVQTADAPAPEEQ
ncbi:MAG: transcription termination/antitermination protein NusA [Clostridia bacterium]|nr:transcription termination/antitermination protein NusA [Clostridia bacterium]